MYGRYLSVIVLLVLLGGCNKIDLLLQGKNSPAKYVPVKVYNQEQVFLEARFSPGDKKPFEVSHLTYFNHQIDLKLVWAKNKLIALDKSNLDTLFVASLNKDGFVTNYEVKEINDGNNNDEMNIPHITFEYDNNRIKHISYPYNGYNLYYDFDYDQKGNLTSALFHNGNVSVDKVEYKYDYSAPVANQYYGFWSDIMYSSPIIVLDFLGLLPGLQPKNKLVELKVSPYHTADELERLMVTDHTYKKGNLISLNFAEQDSKFPLYIDWKALPK